MPIPAKIDPSTFYSISKSCVSCFASMLTATPRRGELTPSPFCLDVDETLGQVGQLGVGSFFLFQRLTEEVVDLVLPQHLGVGGETAVGGDLVMLDLLGCRDQGRVEYFRLGLLL